MRVRNGTGAHRWLTVRAEQPSLGKLEITIRYRVRATNAQFNLVYPFYLQEGTAQ